MTTCPPDAALRDCQGCRIKPECKADMRLYQQIQAARKRRPVIIAEEPIPRTIAPVIDAEKEWRERRQRKDTRQEQEITMKDCAVCVALRICDAHVTNGPWKHRDGMHPCKIID